MNIKILKGKKRYYFLINKKKYILTPNGNLLEAPRKRHAEIIVKEIKKQRQSKDPNSITLDEAKSILKTK